MLDFLKNLFKKEKTELKQISFEEIGSWFNEKSDSYYREFNSKREYINSKITEALQKTRDSIEKLRSAELHNKNIPMRESQFMEGNREAYAKRAGLFLDRIGLPGDIEEINDFCSFFENELNSFKKSAVRPYQILQHFFGHETNNILHNIKTIENLAKELEQIANNSEISSISAIKKRIDDIKSKQSLKETLKRAIIEKEQEKKELKEELNSSEANLNELKKSREFAAYSKKTDELKKIKEKIMEKERDLTFEFSALEKAMKKYAKISFEHESLINQYIRNPSDALLNDSDLKILDVFEKLSNSIVMDKIELKDKKKEKSLKLIRKLDREFFENFLLGYNELVNKNGTLEKEAGESNIKQIFYNLKDKLERNKESLENMNKELEQMKKEVEKIKIKEMRKELEENIKDVSGETIIIT